MVGKNRVLPLLAALCTAIDRIFIEEVGPFGQLVVRESREKWQAAGPRIRTSDVDDYIALLANEIPEPERRTGFIARARLLVGQY
jgi:hypothetical protein